MAKPKIAVFSGPTATISNSPTLVTSNRGRLPGERMLEGRFDHLVSQSLYEPVKVKIKKYSGHPLEEDALEQYHDDGLDYYEVELRPEDGPYLLPYMARRSDGSANGVPFESDDMLDASLKFGGRQFFYPDASRIFIDIDRTIPGRDENGMGSILDQKADFDFIRAVPPGGYTKKGEKLGVDYFPYRPMGMSKTPRYSDAAKAINSVWAALKTEEYVGCIWLQGSPTVEETVYWLGLLMDTDLPLVGIASQRPHGQLANDGDRNIVDAVQYVVSGLGKGLGAVGMQDQQIFAGREFKKGDARPGGYKATGGHGGILGTVGPPMTIYYRPAYKHTSSSEVNMSRLPSEAEFLDTVGDSAPTRISIKHADGRLKEDMVPRVHIVKYASYNEEDETENPDHEVDILARIDRGLKEQSSNGEGTPRLHGFVMEGTSPFGRGSRGQHAALALATYSGMPVVMVGRSDPWGTVPTFGNPLLIKGSNLDSIKARLLLMASMLKLGRLPKAKDPRNPTSAEREAVVARIGEYQRIFESH